MGNKYIPEIDVPQAGWWFVFQCLISGDQLFIDPDRSNGAKRPPAGSYMHSCHSCQKVHEFDAGEIQSICVEA